MLNFRNDQARQEIADHVRAVYPMIDVYPGRCRYNFRCHNNAYHEAIESEQAEIAQVIYIDGGYPIIHYVNIDKDGAFVDNTLGHHADKYEFYLVKKVHSYEFDNLEAMHQLMRKEFQRVLSWYNRMFSDYTG